MGKQPHNMSAWELVKCPVCRAFKGRHCLEVQADGTYDIKVNKNGSPISHTARNVAGREERKRLSDQD